MPTGNRGSPPGSFMAQLDSDVAASLHSAGVERRYRAGTVLLHQGDPSQHVVIIETGWVKVTATSRSGWEALLAIRGPGDILGELSALDGLPRLATVTALTPIVARLLTEDRLKELLRNSWPLSSALLRHVVANLREADRRRIQYGGSNGDGRIVSLLHELAVRHGRRTNEGVLIDLPLSQQDLASSVGVSREVVARTLRVLRARSIVTTQRRQVLIVEPNLLRLLAKSVSELTEQA